jgi:tripartite-type tricarboxylate transporter receptor subunit TctC
MNRTWALLLAALAVAAGTLDAQAQTWPTRTIRLIAPYAPGGIADIAARLVGQKLSEALGQSVITENRPGANGFLGVGAVAKAEPDGYTLLVATTGDLAISPVVFKKVPYDVGKDLVPITMLSDTPTVLATPGGSPFKTVADVLKAAREKPNDPLAMATPGIGSINQLAFEWMGLGTGVKFLHVPYKGGAPASTALAAGDVPLGVLAISSVNPFLQNGKIRVLAVTTAKRSSFNPQWPTLQESGVPEVDVSNWTCLMAPAGTPQAVIDRIRTEVVRILDMPDIKERFAAGGAVTIPTTAAELDARIKRETVAFKTVVEKANIRVE